MLNPAACAAEITAAWSVVSDWIGVVPIAPSCSELSFTTWLVVSAATWSADNAAICVVVRPAIALVESLARLTVSIAASWVVESLAICVEVIAAA